MVVLFGLTNNQLMSILLIVLMVGSIAGFAVWSSEGRKNTEPVKNQPELPTNSIKFTAENVKARVENTFNYLIITGNTKEFEINKIDAELKSVQGIKQVNSRFGGDLKNTLGNGMVYIAEITFTSGKKPMELIQEIKAKATSLENIQGILNAVVIIPKKVTLTNKDLNLTKEQEFKETKTQALVLPTTIPGDELLVSLEVSLNNNLVLSQKAFEEKNLTGEPIPVSLEKELDVNKLKPELVVNLNIKRSLFENEEKINNSIKNIEGVTNSETIILRKGNTIKTIFNKLTETDANNLINFIEVKAEPDLNNSTIFFELDSNSNYTNTLNLINEKINELNMDLNKLKEPNISLETDLNINSIENSKKISEKIIELFEQPGFETSVKQKAVFFTEKLVNDKDESFEVEEPFETLITPGETKAKLSIFFYGVRGKTKYLQAEEI